MSVLLVVNEYSHQRLTFYVQVTPREILSLRWIPDSEPRSLCLSGAKIISPVMKKLLTLLARKY